MKKVVLVMSILLAGTLLTGCISIPLGDSGKLVISMDGINIEANDTEEVIAEGDIEVDDEAGVEEDVGIEEKETDDVEATGQEVESTTNPSSCEDDYSLILDDMPSNFPMPDCATITSVSKSQSNIDAYYNVEGDWIDIYKLYQNHFGDEISSQYQKPENKRGEVHSKTEEFDITIQLSQRDDGFVEVRVLHYFADSE